MPIDWRGRKQRGVFNVPRKRDGVYYLDLRAPSGEKIRRFCVTSDRKEANEHHDKPRAELWRVHKLGKRRRYAYEEAAVRYPKEQLAI